MNSVLAQSGEDDVIFSDSSDYAANIEFAEAVAPKERAAATEMTGRYAERQNHRRAGGAVQPADRKTVKTLLVKAVEDSASRWLPCWCAAITS